MRIRKYNFDFNRRAFLDGDATGGVRLRSLCGLLLLLAACGRSSVAVAGDPGDIVTSKPVQLYVLPLVPFAGKSHAITYRSTDHHGRPVLVTGTVTTPRTRWTGPGQRPIVTLAVGAHGVGDACAPSRLMAQGTDYEAQLVIPLLLRGYGVVITDYAGVGTDAPSTFVNRLGQGHAVLDAIRAAQHLPEADLPDDGPVASFGYAQGGVGSGAAVELQSSYAPELHFIGAYAGSISSDQRAVVNMIDGGPYAGLMGFFLNGLNAAFPENQLFGDLNDAGKAFAMATSKQCVPLVVAPHVLKRSSALFADGRSLGEHLGDLAWQAPLAADLIGQAKPSAPVLVAHSVADDVVPDASTREAARRWCALGATVQFSVIPVPGHILAGPVANILAVAWLADRIAGKAAINNCGEF